MRSTSKRANQQIRTLAQACGNKWPVLMPVPTAAAYVQMTEYAFRRTPQLAGLIKIVWGRERVGKDALDAAVKEVLASEEA